MAEETAQQRSIPPTEHRRREAREQGQVAVSIELTAGLLLLTGVVALWLGGGHLAGGLLDAVRDALRGLGREELGEGQAHALLAGMGLRGLTLTGVVLGLMLVLTLVVGVLQVGFHVVPALVAPNWDRVSPANGWSRLFGGPAAVRGVLAVLKVSVAALLAFWVLKGRANQISAVGEGTLATAGVVAWGTAVRLALAIAAAMLLLGLADYLYQRWRHEQALHLTPQEFKEEVKREEGDPQMKARVRKLQREAVRKRMWEDVPRATVVVTNPTHLAVALRYDRATMPAPKVVAKGAGHVAERIVRLARNHAVPVVERKPLAQALYRTVKVGQELPLALYVAVAEVIAHVYRLRGTA